MPIKDFHQSREVRQAAGEAVDFVDHDDVDLSVLDIVHQSAQRGPLHIATREAAIVIAIGHSDPAFMALAGNVGKPRITLRLQAVVFHVQAFIGGLSGVDRTAPLGGSGRRLRIGVRDRSSHANAP